MARSAANPGVVSQYIEEGTLLRLATDSVALVSNRSAKKALTIYRERWQIETMFKAFKSHGFNYEQTHLRHQERLWKLTALLAIAFIWAYRIGHFIHTRVKPIRVKKHGRKLYSIFTVGFRFLKRALFQRDEDIILCFQKLSCT